MWCTACHTPFRWSTLTIEKHILPNPHYYEYLAKTATSLCMDTLLLDQRHAPLVQQRIESLTCALSVKDRLMQRLRYVIRLREVDYTELPLDNEWTHHELRIKYVRKEITLERYKSLLYLEHKRLQSKRSYQQILYTYLSIMSEWLRSLTEHSAEEFIKQEQTLQDHMNPSILHLGHSFSILTME